MHTNSDPQRPSRRWHHWLCPAAAHLLALLMGSASLWLFTRNNDFPVHYHPDEWTKARQLMSLRQDRNFNHPLLMLEAANIAQQWFGVPRQTGPIVSAGRWTSASLAAIGVFALALASYRAHGFTGLLIGGLTIALCPPLLVYAHYFKEDASLVAGIMVAILGAGLLIAAERWWTQLLSVLVLAAGCGTAISAKYVGAVLVVPCLVAIIIASPLRWWLPPARLLVFLLITTTLVVAVNFRAFQDWTSLRLSPQAWSRMVGEIDHGTSGHGEISLPLPNAFCLRVACSELMAHLWILMAVGIAWIVARRRVTRWGVALAAFLLTLVIALSFSAIPFGRYALPITVCAYFVAAQLGASVVSDLKCRTRWGTAALWTCLGTILIAQGQRCLDFNEQFRDDSRQRLREWIAANLPRGSFVATDHYTELNEIGDPWRHPNQPRLWLRLWTVFHAADAAESVEALASRGVQYVAVAEPSYGRFFVRGVRAIPGYERLLARRQQFYKELFAHGRLLWWSKPDPPTHANVNPEIRLYQISHLARAAGKQPQQPRGLFDWLNR